MKYVLFFASMLVSVLNPLFGYEIPDKEKPMKGLKSKIKIEYQYDEKFGEFIETVKIKTISQLDSSGNLKNRKQFNSENKLTKEYVFEYDLLGNEVVYQEISPDGRKGVDRSWINEYDSLGRLIQRTDYNYEKKPWRKKVYKYDSRGNLIEKSYYWGDTGKIDEKDVYIYDSEGRLIEEATYEGDGSTINKSKYIYDSNGNRIESSSFGSRGRQTGKVLYKYRGRDKLEETEEFSSDGLLERRSKYDFRGEKVETIAFTSRGLVDYKTTFKYDSKSNVIEERDYNSDGSLSFLRMYEYDKYGRVLEYKAWHYKEMFDEIREFPRSKTVYTYELY